MTGTIASRLLTLYDNLVISLNFVVNEIKTVYKKSFFDGTIQPESKTISSTTYTAYPISTGKMYDIDLTNVSDPMYPMFDLCNEVALLTSECPAWHFFFTAGSTSPAWARTLSNTTSGITITWASTPTFTSGKRYEIDIVYLNKTNGTYEGLFIEQEAAS